MANLNNDSKVIRAQGRVIRAAIQQGRTLAAWSVRLGSGETRVVLAVTDRGAASLAQEGGAAVVRVGPAYLRDLATAVSAALRQADAASPERAPRLAIVPRDPRSPGSPREPSVKLAPNCSGVPRRQPSARPRHRWVGEPIASHVPRPDAFVSLCGG